ncbi:MAG: type II toxin-antitoxin system Phd/YefM family antitoxin [Treponema sp.]|nr:type II toxin-antitoxin system Phd/YefM family antitoxin [Treponema sp.]MBP5752789.1 type II toxin-antitoxin system Phd/YefM family antitoxin [Treponema sp.]
MCRATIYDARNNFSSLVKIAEGGEPVELTRHDKPVAVIISWAEYEKSKKPGFCEWLEEFRKENADLLPEDGIPIPKDEMIDEKYTKKIKEMWG